MSEENGNGKVTLAVLKNEIGHIKGDIKAIKENHLEHIYDRLDGISKWLIGILGGLVVSLALLVANLLTK